MTKFPFWSIFLCISLLVACERTNMTTTNSTSGDEDLSLAFQCVHEKDTVPPISPEADRLFQQARSAQQAAGPKDFNAIVKIYEKAGALGHWKALQNAQILYYQELTDYPGPAKRVIEINEQLIKMKVAVGYYNMATYLDSGYGVKQDKEAALIYYRKSADLGSPNGQSYVGRLLTFKLKKREIGTQMLDCAVAQGSGEAARHLASYYQIVKDDYGTSLKWLQKAVSLGYGQSAFTLENIFENGPKAIVNYGNPVDAERARRYGLIGKELEKNPNARFPDIDKIVPLPPAPLPKWSGEFAYKLQKT
jgi:uncharacterized protein